LDDAGKPTVRKTMAGELWVVVEIIEESQPVLGVTVGKTLLLRTVRTGQNGPNFGWNGPDSFPIRVCRT
jgi:hypothetical protein